MCLYLLEIWKSIFPILKRCALQLLKINGFIYYSQKKKKSNCLSLLFPPPQTFTRTWAHKCNHSLLSWKTTLLLWQAIFTYAHRALIRWWKALHRCDLWIFFWCSRGFAQRARIKTHFSKLRPSCLNHPLRLIHSFIAQILHSQAGNWCNLAQCQWPTHTVCNLFAIFGFFFFLSCFFFLLVCFPPVESYLTRRDLL